jgi:hypothetical protein
MKYLLLVALLITSVASAASNEELERRIEILAQEIQDLKANQFKIGNNTSVYGFGPSASKVYQIKKGVSIGGYGEIVFSNRDNEDENGNTSTNNEAKSEVLRQIIYLGYKFNKNWVLNTEIEIEHVDEIFAEFAYLDYLHSQEINFRAGLLLLPMGLVNELHEPTLFNSVSRPEVEKYLIPSTWRENGFGVFGNVGNWEYRAYVVNGMDGDSFNRTGVRGGRKKGGVKERSTTTAATGKFNYNFSDSSYAGFAFYAGSASSEDSENFGVRMIQLHGEHSVGAWDFRALFVNVVLDGVEDNTNAMNSGTGNAGNTAEEMEGYYIEASYDVWANKMNKSLRPFIRYESINTQKSMPIGYSADKSHEFTNIVVGLAYRPIDRIIFKADFTKQESEAEDGVDKVEVGIGYNF